MKKAVKFRIVVVLCVFLFCVSSVFAAYLGECPSEQESERTRFVLSGTVDGVVFNESVAGADYYVAKVKIEELRKGEYLEADLKQRPYADPELAELNAKDFVEFKFDKTDLDFTIGEKVKVYLRKDFYSNTLWINFKECGKVTLEKAPLFNRFMGNNYLDYSFIALVAVVLFVFMMKKFGKK